MKTITENIQQLLSEIPETVTLVAAAKTRTPEEVAEAIEAGVSIIGENYVQEAEAVFNALGHRAQYHFIGHLQRNKVKKAVEVFNLIETVDSIRLALEISKRCGQIEKDMPVLIEINSGREPQKFGVFPEEAESLIRQISELPNIRVSGLMTMGPFTDDADTVRPYFTETKRCFDQLMTLDLPGVAMDILSMGMSGSYKTAIEEGATHVRIGTKIFGVRQSCSL
ncbi:YggS family pyridoxal phosphate-dependent enzyme [bacterium]|nr:YggS family pyridoxal phosphate-dependent enzyme [bacterium]